VIAARQIVMLASAAALIAILGVTHGFAYRHGKAVVQARLDAEIIRQSQAAIKAEQEARAKEQSLQEAKQKAEAEYAETKKKAASDAALANSELERLRDALASRDRAASQDPATERRAYGATVERKLFGECAQALVGMASDAQIIKDRLVGLQSYVRNVCLK
jgi:Skp family chaperone for outer membrane proteins